MKIAVAEISQETDTFSPILTDVHDFEQCGLYFGEEILEKQRGVGVIGGCLAAAQEETDPVELLPILRAWAMSSGRVTADALDLLVRELVSGLSAAQPVDGVFLSLHGAAACEKTDDVEGVVLAAVRELIGDDLPLVVPLDHHANVTKQMVRLADMMVGHETQPHQPFETGFKAAKKLFALVRREHSPAVAWVKIPMIAPQEQFLTSAGPMKAWFDLAREMERRPGVLAVSPFPMQPWLDVLEAGWSTVVYTDRDPDLAQALAADLADKAWELRDAFWELDSVSPELAIRRAMEAARGLVILSDTGDSVLGGAPGDSTCLLREMLEQRITCTALVSMFDPQVVEVAFQAGLGSTITVPVGAKFDNVFSKPVTVTGRVAGLTEGRLEVTFLGLESFDMGKTALLEIGDIKLVVSEYRGIGGNHPVIYRRFDVEPGEAKMVVLKTASNFQYYRSMASELIRVDTPGPTTSHLERLDWQKAPRPIYPLDTLREWRAKRN